MPGGGWTPPETRAYDGENHLQEILVAEPSWVPGVDPPTAAASELPVGGKWIDVCIVGREGSVTVVECKLASNTESRRQVIGQVMDYASLLWTEGADSFLTTWQERTKNDLTGILDENALDSLCQNIEDGRIDLCRRFGSEGELIGG